MFTIILEMKTEKNYSMEMHMNEIKLNGYKEKIKESKRPV